LAKRFFIETFGCQMNVHDSERLRGLLETAGFESTEVIDDADLVLINTCSVRERAQEKLFARLDRFNGKSRESRPTIAVTGCVAQQEGAKILERSPLVDVVVGTQALTALPKLVLRAEQESVPQINIEPYDSVSFPLGIAVRKDPVKAYVSIIEGCNDFCSYCVVPYTRGHERMRPAFEIIDEIAEAVASGRTEIHLLGQIVNHYQAPDIEKCGFSELLARIDRIAGVSRIRFASPHPRHVTTRVIDAIRDLPSVCKHLHLPAQSGSTRTLERMRRRYTRDDYLRLVEKIRRAIPRIALSTDMIVGFPGESREDFAETLSLTQEVGFKSMFSFKYSERPNTLAQKRMPDDVSEVEKGFRLTELQRLQQGIQLSLNKEMLGQTVEVLVEATSRRRNNEMFGRTTGNTVVNFPGEQRWVGQLANVKIERIGPNSVWGRVFDV